MVNEKFQVSKNTKLQALKDTYWNETIKKKDLQNEFRTLYSCLSTYCAIENPKEEQIRAAYNILPDKLIFAGFELSFQDLLVTENTLDFFEKNLKEITQHLKFIA